MNSLKGFTSPEPELDEAQRSQHATIRLITTAALISAFAGVVLCFLFVFQIAALVLAAVALRQIQQTDVGTEYRTRAIIAILIAILGLIIILIVIVSPEMRFKWPT